MKTLLMVTFCLSATGMWGQETFQRPGFTGGMFYGGCYVSLQNSHTQVSGTGTCLGGRLSFYVNSRFCVGGRGNSVRFFYDEVSSFRMGSGGVTAGMPFFGGRWMIVPGLYSGGGRLHNNHSVSVSGAYHLVDYSSDAYFFAGPELSITYRLNEKMGISLISDFLFFNRGNPAAVNRFDFCAGILFFR